VRHEGAQHFVIAVPVVRGLLAQLLCCFKIALQRRLSGAFEGFGHLFADLLGFDRSVGANRYEQNEDHCAGP